MSFRPKKVSKEAQVAAVRQNIASLKEACVATDTACCAPEAPAVKAEAIAAPVKSGLRFSDLSETEKSAASLGVAPNEWKPIGWLNEGHYKNLIKANALDGNLARRIEVSAPRSQPARSSCLHHQPLAVARRHSVPCQAKTRPRSRPRDVCWCVVCGWSSVVLCRDWVAVRRL